LEQAIVVGEYGEVVVAGSGEQHEEAIGDEQTGPRARGSLRGGRVIGGLMHAVGMGRQIYRREARNEWRDLAPDLGATEEEGAVGFEGVDGFGIDELYCVGWKGEIHSFDGREWHRAGSPTNLILTDVCCAGDGRVYACGQAGTLVRGRGEQWEQIDTGGLELDLWGVRWFDGALYFTSMSELFRLSDGELERVETGDVAIGTCYGLSVTDEVLWSIGAKDLVAFDGTVWSRID
jgi:hypothetical protein